MKWLEKFISQLAKLLKEPPYLVFLFVGAVLVVVSVVFGRYFEQIWIFFLYSTGGTVWRYIERDVRKNVLKTERFKTASIVVYHAGNVGFFLALLNYLTVI